MGIIELFEVSAELWRVDVERFEVGYDLVLHRISFKMFE